MKKYSDEEIRIVNEEYFSDKYNGISLDDLYYEMWNNLSTKFNIMKLNNDS